MSSSACSARRAALAVLLFGIAYLPLEEFLLKWAPGGSLGYAVLRLGFEALLYGAVAALAAARLVRGLRLRATPIDVPLLAFLVLALGSLLLSEGSRLAGLLNLRVLVRYVAVFYLAAWLEPGPRERRRILGWVLAAAALQGALGLLQHFQGGASEFWLPRADPIEVAGIEHEFAALGGGLELGAVVGTTDHSVGFALFLLVAGTLAGALYFTGALAGRARALLGGLLALLLAGIVFSYVRSCLFALGLTLACLAWSERRGAPVRRLAPAFLVLLPLLLAALLAARGGQASGFVREKETRVSPLASVEALFTSEYLQAAEGSRLWVLREVGGEIARSAGWLGFGPDQENVKRELLESGGAALHRLIAYRAFEDVYWVALLAYYGFGGLALFLLLLARLAPAARRVWREGDALERASAGALLALLFVVVPLSFLTPTFDLRTFAFYFWLLAGLGTVRSAPEPRPEARRALVPLGRVPEARLA